MHANTIYKETKTAVAVAVALIAILAAAAVVFSSESSADTSSTDKYSVVILQVSESGSVSTNTLNNLAAGIPIYVDDDGTNTLHVNKAKMTPSIPVDTERYAYDFSGWMYKATDADDSEYAPIPADGIVLSENTTVKGTIIRTTQQFEVTVVSSDDSYGTVGFFVPDQTEAQSSVEVSYRSEIYKDGDSLYLNDIENGVSYVAIATPADPDSQFFYVFDSWDLSVSQITATTTVTASFVALPLQFAVDGVVYQITSLEHMTVSAIGIDGTPSVVTVLDSVVYPETELEFTPTEIAGTFAADSVTLSSVLIGANVSSIEDGALVAPALTAIAVSKDNGVYSSVSGVLYDKDVSVLMKFPASKQRLVIPGTVSSIAASAFQNAGAALKAGEVSASNKYITYIAIPANVKEIGDNAFAGSTIECLKFSDGVETLGDNAFANCAALNYIVFPTTIVSAGEGAFDGCVFHGANGEVMSYSADDFKGYKFTSETDYTDLNVYVPETHSSIHKDGYIYRIFNGEQFLVKVYGFDGDSIKNVVIAETVSYLGFEYTVTGIMDKAFYCDKTIASVECFGDIGYKAFANCSSLESIVVGNASAIGDYAFSYCTSLDDAVFSDSLAKLGNSAFFGCTAPARFDLSNVSVISERAFARCPLTCVDVSAATEIGLGAFTGTAFGEVVFGDSLVKLDSRAFYGYEFHVDGSKVRPTIDNLSGSTFSGQDGVLDKE